MGLEPPWWKRGPPQRHFKAVASFPAPVTHPPILKEPTPPFQARTNDGSASSETGLKEPVAKYGPTGPTITNSNAWLARVTPSDGWKHGRRGQRDGQRVNMMDHNTSDIGREMRIDSPRCRWRWAGCRGWLPGSMEPTPGPVPLASWCTPAVRLYRTSEK